MIKVEFDFTEKFVKTSFATFLEVVFTKIKLVKSSYATLVSSWFHVEFVILKLPKNDISFLTGQMKYQYFIEVVPTDIQTLSGTWRTYQYSVKELARPIDHETGSHGAPGIYFRYDMSALKVVVKQDREPFWQWLVKLCAGAGGLISTSTIFCDLLSWLRLMIWPSKAEKLSTTSSTSGSSGTTES